MATLNGGLRGLFRRKHLILGNIDGNKSFEDLLRQAWETATDNQDLASRIENLGDLLTQARREYERVRQNNALLDTALDL